MVWDAVRTFYRGIRRRFIRSSEHPGPAIVVEMAASDVESVLGRTFFAPNWEFSYYERGEDLNLARVRYDRRRIRGHTYVWWQNHVRGWEFGEEGQSTHTRLRAHFELEPTEYDQDHIDGVGLDIDRGLDSLGEVLEAAGVPHDRFENLPTDCRYPP